MTVLLLVIGFVATGLLIGLFATSSAPVGYEDETGFHFGPEQGASLEVNSLRNVPTAHLSPKPA